MFSCRPGDPLPEAVATRRFRLVARTTNSVSGAHTCRPARVPVPASPPACQPASFVLRCPVLRCAALRCAKLCAASSASCMPASLQPSQPALPPASPPARQPARKPASQPASQPAVAVLCCAVLCSALPCCAAQCCAVLCRSVQARAESRCVVLCGAAGVAVCVPSHVVCPHHPPCGSLSGWPRMRPLSTYLYIDLPIYLYMLMSWLYDPQG